MEHKMIGVMTENQLITTMINGKNSEMNITEFKIILMQIKKNLNKLISTANFNR